MLSRNIKFYVTEPDDLDYDFMKCNDYCYTDPYDYGNGYDRLLCNCCKKLLDEKIRIPFNKTPREIGKEFQALNDRIEELEKLVQTILANSNKDENI